MYHWLNWLSLPKAKSWPLVGRTLPRFLCDWSPLWERDLLSGLQSHHYCCLRSYFMGLQAERPLIAYPAILLFFLSLKQFRWTPRGQKYCRHYSCWSCFPTTEEDMIFKEAQGCLLLNSDFLPSCPSNILASHCIPIWYLNHKVLFLFTDWMIERFIKWMRQNEKGIVMHEQANECRHEDD